MLRAIGRVIEPVHRDSGFLVTFNGTAHDLPVLRRRAAANWLFDEGLALWSDDPAGRHIDLFREPGGSGTGGASLQDECAALMIGLHRGPARGRSLAGMALRKAQTDVVATFILLLHELSLQARSDTDLRSGVSHLAGHLRQDWPEEEHLSAFRTMPIFRAVELTRSGLAV